ncbi:c-type cytochrome [Massilia horti]|uniref:C-type cytochrome n=1 Tax=Massilia horti TaxID=2562153 RepID=A0A4Y9SY33_9BURK|nr:c-type cytochrome [Massilia horti]TFW31349.1 c-type cytochrome [Massilia horti]
MKYWWLLLFPCAAQAQELTAQQQRGRAIYVEGRGAQAITASVAGMRQALPATLLPCASCHGANGRGQREGGVAVADISPAALARAVNIGGRLRPAYTQALLVRAIGDGQDSQGQPLDRAMPRYRMQTADARALLSYLAILDSVTPTGVSADAVRINVIGAAGLTVPQQPIYGRRIVLRYGRDEDAFLTIDAAQPIERAATREQQIAALRDYAASQGAQALLLNGDCGALATADPPSLVLMTAETASGCRLDSIPAALDRRIVVAAAAPPDSRAAAQAQLSEIVATLARVGRDFTRKSFLQDLEQTRRRNGAVQAWLMTLDLHRQVLYAEPGWWPAVH